MIASSSPRLGWLAPQAAPVAQTAPDMIAPAAPAAPSPDRQQLNAMSLGLAVVRQSVDQLAAQLAAGQEQMTREITKLRAAEQDILDKISAPPPRPAAAPARKPVPLTPPVRDGRLPAVTDAPYARARGSMTKAQEAVEPSPAHRRTNAIERPSRYLGRGDQLRT
jgi:hypothetical protein